MGDMYSLKCVNAGFWWQAVRTESLTQPRISTSYFNLSYVISKRIVNQLSLHTQRTNEMVFPYVRRTIGVDQKVPSLIIFTFVAGLKVFLPISHHRKRKWNGVLALLHHEEYLTLDMDRFWRVCAPSDMIAALATCFHPSSQSLSSYLFFFRRPYRNVSRCPLISVAESCCCRRMHALLPQGQGRTILYCVR